MPANAGTSPHPITVRRNRNCIKPVHVDGDAAFHEAKPRGAVPSSLD